MSFHSSENVIHKSQLEPSCSIREAVTNLHSVACLTFVYNFLIFWYVANQNTSNWSLFATQSLQYGGVCNFRSVSPNFVHCCVLTYMYVDEHVNTVLCCVLRILQCLCSVIVLQNNLNLKEWQRACDNSPWGLSDLVWDGKSSGWRDTNFKGLWYILYILIFIWGIYPKGLPHSLPRYRYL